MRLSLSLLLFSMILSVNAGCKEHHDLLQEFNTKGVKSLIIDGHKYKIGDKLGSGKYGAVYIGDLVRNHINEARMGPVIALKIISNYKPEAYIVEPEILGQLKSCNVYVEEWYFFKIPIPINLQIN